MHHNMKEYNQNLQYSLIRNSIIILFTVTLIEAQKLKEGWALVGNPLLHAHPCKGNDDILLSFESGLPPEEENQYNLYIPGSFPQNSKIEIKFDSEASVTLMDASNARISTISNIFIIDFFRSAPNINLKIKGPKTGTIPYIQSLVINTVENCKDPQTGILDPYILGKQNTAEISLTLPDSSCGRRKVIHTELIVNGQPTKPGDWPWHTAIYKLDGSSINYICGGTLLSKTVVLTAAHCVTIRGVPRTINSLSVVLGKYNLIGGDIDPQEREVQEIIVHEQYEYPKLNKDLALLRLRSEVVFTDYVQPACLWHSNAYKKLPQPGIFGTVVGWGFDQTKRLSSQLQQTKMPKVSELNCIKSNPVFFSRLLNDQKFCAGTRNGTSACNGDSGGGFMVFVPDVTGDASVNATGAWHVRGIVSTSVSRNDEPICDPNHYVLFTDVAKFRGWILKNMD